MRCAILCLLMLPLVINAQDAEYKPPRTYDYGVIGIAIREDMTVLQGGARDAEGKQAIEPGDKLLTWNGEELKDRDTFCRKLYATKPGETVEVEFERKGKDDDKAATHTANIKLGDRKQLYADIYKHLDKRKRTFDWREQESVTKGGPLRERLAPVWRVSRLDQSWAGLIAANERELDLWDSFECTTSCELLLREPLAAHQWINATTGQLLRKNKFNVELIPCLLDRAPEVFDPPRAPSDAIPEDKEEARKEMSALWRRILAPCDLYGNRRDDPEFKALLASMDDFSLATRGEPGFDSNIKAVHRLRAIQPELGQASAAWGPILSFLAGVTYERTKDSPAVISLPEGVNQTDVVEGEAVFLPSPYGLVAIGSEGHNVWKGGPDAPAVIIDVGGDDEYINCATTRFGHAISIVVDMAGNDSYCSTASWGIASGVLGTSLLYDRHGDDTYDAKSWSIGTAFGGVGLLVDDKGNDRYLGGGNCIGCAAYGVGGVIDLDGRDVYDSHSYSIGVGHPGGVGFALDGAGDDTYRCGGVVPSPYGTEGEYLGMGIGCGFGWRGLASGGIGLVVDVAGNDIYDAGEFGLGCGYYLGVGVVRDMAGDDIYHSSRYGLAAAAHCAVGLFMDDSGRDTYEGKTAASMAGAWDIATCYFYDGAGDDTYRCDGLGLGGASQNAVAIFWDAGGNDVYRANQRTIAEARGTEYAAGRLAKNFGVFIDSGGKDSYPRDDRKDGQSSVSGEYEVFIDD